MIHEYLKDAHDKFYLKGGMSISNLNELAHTFKQMSQEEFNHHVSDERNDFSSWISACIGDNHLAEKLRQARNTDEAKNMVKQRVLQLNHLPDSTQLTNRPEPQQIKTEQVDDQERAAIMKDINLLSQLNTQSFLRTYFEKDYVFNPGVDDGMKESDASLRLFKQGTSITNKDFLRSVNILTNLIEIGELKTAKELYTHLKNQFSQADLTDKKKLHGLLMNCYDEIKKRS